MEPTANIREEEIKNTLRDRFFQKYDATAILGDIDFAVTHRREVANQQELFEEWYLWAEAKAGTKHSLVDSFVQLIITIGKAHTHEKHMPPMYLGAFDEKRIAFIEFHHVVGIFYQNDFNWNVTPSNHSTKEFQQLKAMLEGTLHEHIAVFHQEKDEKALRQFIARNFREGRKTDGVAITRNNYLFVFQRWVEEVKPTIDADWSDIPASRVVDFFYADLISRGDYTLRSDLAVVLRGDEYKMLEEIRQSGKKLFSEWGFTDKMKAYRAFWNKYKRPPRQEAIDIILERRDLLIPHNLRQYQGAFFTPPQWVELSQRYLADELGEDWQQQYYVWDCCAGTGNLLFGLTEPYRVWASTLDLADVRVMKERIADGTLDLLEKHVFQFDFLNDDFKNLPESLRAVIEDPEERKRLVIYINPPYAEASNARAISGEGVAKTGVSDSHVKTIYKKELGRAANEVFAQFYARIIRELHGVQLANFSTIKILQSSNFAKFRNDFAAKLKKLFLVPAYTFDNVSGKFPIGFHIWNTYLQEPFDYINADVYNPSGSLLEIKTICSYRGDRYIVDFIRKYYDKKNEHIAYMRYLGTDVQTINSVFLTLNPSASDIKKVSGNWVTRQNILYFCIYFAVRHSIKATWLNDRDQFLYPNDGWQMDYEFQSDCLIYAIFSNANNIRSTQGTNHWIPFAEQEVGAQDNYTSHFMIDYLDGKVAATNPAAGQTTLFDQPQDGQQMAFRPLDHLSEEAKTVMTAGRNLWQYYHRQEGANPNASYYDIRLHFQGTKFTKSGKEQMNPDSTDETYTTLHNILRQAMRQLAAHIEPKVYKYGFLK